MAVVLVGSILFSMLAAFELVRLTEASAASRSNEFWSVLRVDGSQYRRFDGLASMAEYASVVLLGRFTDVERGRVFVGDERDGERGKAYYLAASLRIEEVLAGQLRDPRATSLTVELFVPNADAIPDAIAGFPQERSVFFLLNKAAHPANVGIDDGQRAIEEQYYEAIGDQAVLRELNGVVSTRPDLDPDDPIARLDGMGFDELLSQLRGLSE